MVKNTFLNLPPEKKARITKALLTEFSRVPLSQAQVSNIIKEAQIARGAFYKYFTDITDAYDYLYQLALKDLHQNLNFQGALSVDEYLNRIRTFLAGSKASPYYELIRLSMTKNEYFLNLRTTLPTQNYRVWAIATLCHEAIFDCLLDPSEQELYLTRLEKALKLVIP